MSTTVSPSTITATLAPTSAPESMLAASASRTPSNAGSYVPCTSAMNIPPCRRGHATRGRSGVMSDGAARFGRHQHVVDHAGTAFGVVGQTVVALARTDVSEVAHSPSDPSGEVRVLDQRSVCPPHRVVE